MPFTIGTTCAPRMGVTIADDCPAMREGLARLIADECDLAVIDSAATAAELKASVERHVPRVLVMDLALDHADGLALIKDLLLLAPALQIVVFTAQPEDVYAVRCLRAGVRGFIAKRDSVSALFRAIREVASGGLVVPPGLSPAIIGTAATKAAAPRGAAAALSDRELQVFRLVGLAQPTRVIAEKLGVSIKTVETHREHIKNKLSLHSHDELVACAAQWLRENDSL